MSETRTLKWRFNPWMAMIVIGFAFGLFGVVYTLTSGFGAWGIDDQIPWGIVTATYVFLVAASAGCVTISLGHALGVKGFDLIIKKAVLLAIVTLLAGGVLIFLHIGYPLNIFYLLISPNFASPLGWMVSLINSAICFVILSCTCKRRANISTMRGILLKPITLPSGI